MTTKITRTSETIKPDNVKTGISLNKDGTCTLGNSECADFDVNKQKWNCVKDNLVLTDFGQAKENGTGSFVDVKNIFGTGDYNEGDTITYCDQDCGDNQQNTDGFGCMCGDTFLEKGFKCVDNKPEKLSAPTTPEPPKPPEPITKTEQPVITPVSSTLLVAILFVIIAFMLIRKF